MFRFLGPRLALVLAILITGLLWPGQAAAQEKCAKCDKTIYQFWLAGAHGKLCKACVDIYNVCERCGVSIGTKKFFYSGSNQAACSLECRKVLDDAHRVALQVEKAKHDSWRDRPLTDGSASPTATPDSAASPPAPRVHEPQGLGPKHVAVAVFILGGIGAILFLSQRS